MPKCYDNHIKCKFWVQNRKLIFILGEWLRKYYIIISVYIYI